MPGFEKQLNLVGVCCVTMSIMAVTIVPMRVMTVAMIIVATMTMSIVSVATMTMVIISRLFWKLTETSKGTGQLSRPAQQSDTSQHRYIDELTHIVADRQPKHHVFVIHRWGH